MNLLLFELKKQKKGTKKTSIYFYMLTTYRMINDFLKAIETAYNIAQNKEIPYIERRETVKQYYNKANNIYRKIYKDLAWSERREAREPINDLKKHFRF